jgi:hypothetical protein
LLKPSVPPISNATLSPFCCQFFSALAISWELPSELNFTLTTPEAQKRKGKNIEQIKQLEGELLIKASAASNEYVHFLSLILLKNLTN